MNLKTILLAAMLLLSTTGYAADLDRNDAIYAEVKRFWATQLDGGESAVIQKVKACYARHTKPPMKSLQEAEACIIWDVALTGLSFGVSNELAAKAQKPSESLQTSFTRRGNMESRVVKLLNRYGINRNGAKGQIKDIDGKVASVFGRAYDDVTKESGI
ncbi:MAG: hypothetical protein K9K30_07760 [Burkholderiaceae bacterium]|nr:hypothetical protein [Sulfuritalea sp.]MCF8175118.1 hypothetical protein [Burkholderiaceae bacterium]